MKNHNTKRGYVPDDIKEFGKKSYSLLLKAQKDIFYLLEQGYPIKSASTFVGNHYMLSERQRLALARATSAGDILNIRREKKIITNFSNQTVFIDGLNLIITLEVALSGSLLIGCMDGTIRDLAGLRGTYRLIDKTDTAISLIGRKLDQMKISEACFYLDSPVSNTGRLKQRILEILKNYPFVTRVELVSNADVLLENSNYVISSDSIILNKCLGWVNLAADLVLEHIKEPFLIDLSMKKYFRQYT